MANNALILLIVLPVVGMAIAGLLKSGRLARVLALVASGLTLVLAITAAAGVFAGQTPTWEHRWASLPEIGFGVRLACDGISVWLVLLASLITPLAILSVESQHDGTKSAHWLYAWLLLLLGALNGTFLAADGLLFYVFFELTLVPTLLLIGIWGGPDRREAAGKFFIYTFAGSIFLLIALIYLAQKAGNTFEINSLVSAYHVHLSGRERFWVGLGLLFGFLIKTPVFPLHTWQPLAYGEAPNSAAVVMASVLGKLGTYGLVRLALPMMLAADADLTHGNLGVVRDAVIVLCLIGIVYGGLIAWVQKDAVRLMAYSSLSHLGLCVLAIVASSTLSVQGAVMYMIAHGLSTAALLMCIGMIARRTGTRNLDEMSGLFAKMPVLSVLLVLFAMASVGLPITSGFVGEFLSLQGVMNSFGLGITIVAATGMVLGAIYMLHMVAKVGFGPLRAPEGATLTDICPRETAALVPLAIAVLAVGIQPTPILNSFKNNAAALAASAVAPQSTTADGQTEDAAFK